MTHMSRSGLDIITSEQDHITEGDHTAFWHNGFPAVNVRSGHRIDRSDPPEDRINSEDYNLTQASMIARAAASVGAYLALKGNGEPTSYKIQQTIPQNGSAVIKTVMTIPQSLTVSGVVLTSGTATVDICNRSVHYLYPTDITNGSFSLTTESTVSIGPLTLTIQNNENASIFIDMYLNYSSDTDGNAILDAVQYSWPDPDPPLDWDGEGLSDIDEHKAGTDIFVTDTDQDGMDDAIEVENGLNPLIQDTHEDYDTDSLTNLKEIILGTDPLNNDTDGDGMLDGWEVYYGTDPFIDDTELDPDNDTLTNLEEYTYGSDPFSVDGDNDGITDVEEIERGMDPLEVDSDNDGLRDHLELLNGLDPLSPDYDVDLALDGPDRNPRINTILVLGSFILVPVTIGSIFLWRRYQ
jgi:hypothetical protein